jgi:hypothetical protein
MIEIVSAVLGLPPAIYGAIEGSGKLRAYWRDRRFQKRSGDPPFIVLRTYVKYIMWEDHCEMVKLRHIRTFREVRQVKLDRYPRAGILGQEQERPVRDFYSLPGTASQQAEFFVVKLEPGDEFLPGREYSIVFGYIVPAPLSAIHPNDSEEGVTIKGPLGRDEVSLEVHLPRIRRFGPKSAMKVQVVYADGREGEIDPSEYDLDVDQAFKNTDVSRETDVLRFKIRPPEAAADIRVLWSWSRMRA